MSENTDIDAELDAFLAGLDKEIEGSENPAQATPPVNSEPNFAKASEPAPAPAPAQQPAPAASKQEPPAPVTPMVAPQRDGSALKIYVDAEQLKKDVQISITDLDNNMLQHSALYAHYAAQAVDARRQYDRVKSAVEILEAQLDSHYRTLAQDEGRKVTEAALRNQIVADARYAAAQTKLIEASSIWKLADVAERAMGDQRKDLLLEVARDRRKEREGQTRVMEIKAQQEKEAFLAMGKVGRAA